MTACVSFFFIFKKYNMYFVEIFNNTFSDFVAQKR